MNAVEIEQAISELAEKPFDRQEFPFQFLEAFENKETTLKRLRQGVSNKSDLGGLLQTNNIHIATCASGHTSATLAALRASPATVKGKARFILAMALLHKSADGLSAPMPGQTYPTTVVTGMPSAV